MSPTPGDLYADHHAELRRRYEAAMAAHGCEGIVIFAGAPKLAFQDDRAYPFLINPGYRQWVPENDHAWSLLVLRPGKTPRLIFHQPRDYWHVVPSPPGGFWARFFDIVCVDSPAAAMAALPDSLDDFAVLGEPEAELAARMGAGINPSALVRRLHFDRLYKTEYEVASMRRANLDAARGHIAARDAFADGASEFEISLSYLRGVGQPESELPYSSIIALNEHGATLHYDALEDAAPERRHAFLIDAGANCNGYAADITRTWPAPDEARFAELIERLDRAQREMVASVRPGRSYVDLHLAMHDAIGEILAETGIVDMAPEDMLGAGVTPAFFPHGLGHHIGLQVHDVGGKQSAADGPDLPQPDDHPYLRNLRPVEPGNVFTIEPGIYFIPQLLETLRDSPAAAAVDWTAVDAFLPCGGVRVEDDVAVTAGGVENLTRDAFAMLES